MNLYACSHCHRVMIPVISIPDSEHVIGVVFVPGGTVTGRDDGTGSPLICVIQHAIFIVMSVAGATR